MSRSDDLPDEALIDFVDHIQPIDDDWPCDREMLPRDLYMARALGNSRFKRV